MSARDEWHKEALCAQTGDFGFYPEGFERPTEAIATCKTCPVRIECFNYAVENDERWGVWGGRNFATRGLRKRGKA